MYDLTSRFRSFVQPRHPWGYYLEVAQERLRLLAVPVLMVSAIVLGIAAGLAATRLQLKMVQVALGGLAIFWLALRAPELVILLILGMSSTVVNLRRLPSIRRFTPVELGLMLLLGLIVVRTLSNREKEGFVRTPLDWPVFLFFVVCTISFFNAKYNLRTYKDLSIPVWRTLFDYMMFFAVTNFVRTRRQLMTVVGVMLVMATVVAVFMIAQQIVGPSVSIIPGQGGVWVASALGQRLGNVARVAISGASIVYVMLMPAFALYTTPEYLKTRKWLPLIPVVFLPVAIAFTFTRGIWIGTVVSSIIFVIIARSKSKKFIVLILVQIVAFSLLVPLASAYFPRVDNVVEALSLRVGSLFAGDELLRDGSTEWRVRENNLAIAKIEEHPLIGIGPGADYRDPWWNGDGLTYYMHNAYLYLLVDVGIAGLLPFVWFSILFLVRGFYAWYKIQDPILKSLVLSFTLSYVGVLLSAMTSPRLLEPGYTPLIGVLLGINEVIIRLGQRVPPMACRSLVANELEEMNF